MYTYTQAKTENNVYTWVILTAEISAIFAAVAMKQYEGLSSSGNSLFA
jgi:heme/copper-type cytochrome/quinol oxidase subunit 3